MINLPFSKFTLRFHSSEYERLYEIQTNQVRATGFRVANLLVCISSLLSLIMFLVQQQSTLLIIVISLVIGWHFFGFLLAKTLEPYMKPIFSIMYIATLALGIVITYSNDIEIPQFVYAFSFGYLSMGIMQYSDNRVKPIYILLTPVVLIVRFEIYSISTLPFALFIVTCIVFIAAVIYNNEYTSRWAFALEMIGKQQKEIIHELGNDSMFAISLNNRTGQFVLEFWNKKFEDLLQLFGLDIKQTDKMKIFLRNAYCIQQQNKDLKQLIECRKNKQKSTLEEILYIRIKQWENCTNSYEDLPEVLYNITESNQIFKMQAQMQQINFGTPTLLIVIKQDQTPKLIENYEKQIEQYRKAILNQSQQLIKQQISLYKEIKKIAANSSESFKIAQVQSLNLQVINNIRNYLIYYQKDNIWNQTDKKDIDNCKFSNYLSYLDQYFYYIVNNYGKNFKIINLSQCNQQINMNTKYLTQILLNTFDFALSNSVQEDTITLQVQEGYNQNQKIGRITASGDSQKKNEQSDDALDLKQLSFCFCFLSDGQVNYEENIQKRRKNMKKSNCQEANIPQNVTHLLLNLLGPSECISFSCQMMNTSSFQFVNKISFYIYTDQTQLDLSYAKQVKS